jgi:hypothetical protein
MRTGRAVLAFAIACVVPGCALAWGDEGHQIVGLIAEHYLDSDVKQQVDTLLAGDTTNLVPTDIADEAAWADKYRYSDKKKRGYDQTGQWHYVDLELDAPDIDSACNRHPALPAETPASAADPNDCIVDKIDQFAAELSDNKTAPDERRMALQFLLHFLGDLHQPLHAADQQDRGGNTKRVSAQDSARGNLHSYWDTDFVRRLGTDDKLVAASLIAMITPADLAEWRKGSTADWAQESYQIAKSQVYGKLPQPNSDGSYMLDRDYVDNATQIVSLQLRKAGVRLGLVLNRVFSGGKDR